MGVGPGPGAAGLGAAERGNSARSGGLGRLRPGPLAVRAPWRGDACPRLGRAAPHGWAALRLSCRRPSRARASLSPVSPGAGAARGVGEAHLPALRVGWVPPRAGCAVRVPGAGCGAAAWRCAEANGTLAGSRVVRAG